MRYDANKAPDPEEWLELDESERIDAVIAYHRHYHCPSAAAPSCMEWYT
jgi:hypothetical protein